MMGQTAFFKIYSSNIQNVLKTTKTIKDPYLYKLMYAHIITLMEEYLSDAFIETVKQDKSLIRKLLQCSKYKNQSVGLAEAYEKNIDHIIIEKLKRHIYHNLSDIKILYRDTLAIDFKQDAKIIQAIEKRHDIIHRNGKTLNGDPIIIDSAGINELSTTMNQFLSKIDEDFYNLFYSTKNSKT